MVQTEVTAAWLQAVREANLSWAQYRSCLRAFTADINAGVLQLWRDDDLLQGVISVQERVTQMHMANQEQVPILHTHDAYYVALAETLRRDTGDRVILVTNDARVWRCALALGLEVFHGNTCDLGRQRLNVGSPGQDYPDGADCRPCSHLTCPSGFTVDFEALPWNLGSGVPRSRRARAAEARDEGEPLT